MDKYLDTSGLTHFWEKIEQKLSEKQNKSDLVIADEDEVNEMLNDIFGVSNK